MFIKKFLICFTIKRVNRIHSTTSILANFSDIKCQNWIVFIMKICGFLPSLILPTSNNLSNEVQEVSSEEEEKIGGNFFNLRTFAPIALVVLYCLRFVITVFAHLITWRNLIPISLSPLLIFTIKCISSTFCIIFFFIKKSQIEDMIIITSSFLRPMTRNTTIEIIFYSSLMLIVFIITIFTDFVCNILRLSQWNIDEFQKKEQINHFFSQILIYIDLIIKSYILYVLLLVKVKINIRLTI